jgi:hypothetical protein
VNFHLLAAFLANYYAAKKQQQEEDHHRREHLLRVQHQLNQLQYNKRELLASILLSLDSRGNCLQYVPVCNGNSNLSIARSF